MDGSNCIPKAVRKNPPKEVIEFHSKKKVVKDKHVEKPVEDSDDREVVSLKQAKFDVFKYGLKGYSKTEQENLKAKLAIKLGAMPAKNECINYKKLMEMKKEEAARKEQIQKEKVLFDSKVALSKLNFSKKTKTASQRRKSEINKGHVGQLKGHIGSFANGVLKLKKTDLKKLNKK